MLRQDAVSISASRAKLQAYLHGVWQGKMIMMFDWRGSWRPQSEDLRPRQYGRCRLVAHGEAATRYDELGGMWRSSERFRLQWLRVRGFLHLTHNRLCTQCGWAVPVTHYVLFLIRSNVVCACVWMCLWGCISEAGVDQEECETFHANKRNRAFWQETKWGKVELGNTIPEKRKFERKQSKA